MSPEQIAAGAVVLSFASLVVSGWQRRNRVNAGLRTELDQALAENVRLVAENLRLVDDIANVRVKVTPEVLAAYADEAVRAVEQTSAGVRALEPDEKWQVALKLTLKRDAGDNGVQDWTDSEHRAAIEAAVHRLKNGA